MQSVRKVIAVLVASHEKKRGDGSPYASLVFVDQAGKPGWAAQAFEGAFGGEDFSAEERGHVSTLSDLAGQVVLAGVRQMGDFQRVESVTPRTYFVAHPNTCSRGDRILMDNLRFDSLLLKILSREKGRWVNDCRLARELERQLGEAITVEQVRNSARRVWGSLKGDRRQIECHASGNRYRVVLGPRAGSIKPTGGLFEEEP